MARRDLGRSARTLAYDHLPFRALTPALIRRWRAFPRTSLSLGKPRQTRLPRDISPLTRVGPQLASMSAFDTVWPADSVEYCPHPSYRHIFTCGTYKLEETAPLDADDNPQEERTPPPAARPNQKRRGECLLFQVDDELSLYV